MPTSSSCYFDYSYDGLKRLTQRSMTISGNLIQTRHFSYLAGYGSNTSGLISNVTVKNGSGTTQRSYSYSYDNVGNITAISGDTTASYTYDSQNQLTKEVLNGTTYNYTYDAAGNIKTKTKSSGSGTDTYTYGNSNWRDLLTAYNGNTITYDAVGNPLTYYNGTTFTWVNGKRLATAVNTSTGLNNSYTYDADGLRLTKTVNGVEHKYIWQGGKLVCESWSGKYLEFFYDENGAPYGFAYKSSPTAEQMRWYYILNQQGDVMAIVNSSGVIRATYTYNAYGEILSVNNLTTDNLGTLNPLRYRGYYYDSDTNLYYVKSRYYDPQICRFINADDASLIGANGDYISFNLFAYCNNNPINRTDDGGSLSNWAKIAIGIGVIAICAVVTIATGGAAAGTVVAAVHCAASGALSGAAVGAVSGAATGAVAGAVSHRITTGSWEGAGQAAVDGAADGFMAGSVTGAITGAVSSPYCFVAGTLVQTEDGEKPIEEIAVGDHVWAWDEETGEVALKPVLETYVNKTDELIHVYVNGEEIVSTPGHPFYSPVKGWTNAVHLRAGDILVLVNGEYVVVEKVQHELLEAPINVYNFNVEGYHTYYVTSSGVLVHNSCSPDYTEITTGRTTPNNLTEQLAMESARSNPQAGKIIIKTLKDPRIPSDFSKYSQVFDTSVGNIEIHYVGNAARNTFFDFKFIS